MNLEVVIGVTGHRDIEPNDIDKVVDSFKEYILELLTKYPELNFRVLSGLASGADRIITNAVLDISNPRLSCTGVLPLPILDYKNDFSNSECNEFDSLIKNFNQISSTL
ncbi:hypothetical protein [Psychrosphaera algicola]|uniref:Uncharacterized protein n=1 Tax=Psychrosphaera algicola TaxID=3023714 RepID=A0ABT5FFY4_9GAMM|nr:hypothetical protein [Psychrosphaera sp. G1-22]MDC2890459.1 hypothetical protein [Psychrosphaera sp. G1-22]